MEKTNDFMKTGKVFPLLMSMSVPMMISMLIQSLYNIVDSIYVSRLGTDALTAVSLAYPLQNVVTSVAVGIGVGISSAIAIHLGAGRKERANQAATIGMALTVIHCILFVLLGIFVTRPFLAMFTKNDSIVDLACDYTYIVLCLSFGCLLQIAFEKIFQGIGEMKITMIFLATGAIINIILDPIFIFGLHMGVRGAALATIISQGCSCLWCLYFLLGKKTFLRIRKENLLPGLSLMPPCVALGLSAFIMQSTESVISMCFNSSLLKYGGDIAVGAMTILTSVMQFAMLPLQGVAQGAQPITSYNFGAKNSDRVKKSFQLLLLTSLAYSVLLWICVEAFPQVFAGMFTNDATLLAFSANALRIYCGALFMMGIQIACQMTFVSTGNALCSIIVAIMRKFVLLIPLIYILPHFMADKTIAVYTAEPIADFIAVTFTAILFGIQFNKALKKLNAPS